MDNALTPADVAAKLDISSSTLRKYSLILEEHGVSFKRNAKNARQYFDSDVMTLQRMITLMKTDGVTVENAAYAVSKKEEMVATAEENNGVTHDGLGRHNDDISAVMISEIRNLKEEIKQQKEVIDGFRVAQEKRDTYFVEILEELQKEIQQLNEQAALPEPESDSEPVPEKRSGFFSRFFK